MHTKKISIGLSVFQGNRKEKQFVGIVNTKEKTIWNIIYIRLTLGFPFFPFGDAAPISLLCFFAFFFLSQTLGEMRKSWRTVLLKCWFGGQM